MNRRLIYLTSIYQYFENVVSLFDQHLAEADDGSNTSVEDAKKEALQFIDIQIEMLNEYRNRVKNAPYNQIKNEII